jgi:3-isopropylmalate/(R)-2-methylmalate dehydratase small subunit
VQEVRVITGRCVPLQRSDVDTDQIIPSDWLKRVERTGFGEGLFCEWRENSDFVLNQERFQGANVLVAGPNFGTGSSREHAVWALQDYGFAAVISPRFGDIFRNNALKGGLLPVVLPEDVVESLWRLVEETPGSELTVDLVEREVRGPRESGVTRAFSLDDHSRWRLIEGLDDIGLTLRHEAAITEFETSRPSWGPLVA